MGLMKINRFSLFYPYQKSIIDIKVTQQISRSKLKNNNKT